MVAAVDAARALTDVLGDVKQGSLRMYGDWFGKPFDNWHVPVSANVDGDVLVVVFNDDEELRVREPDGWVFTSEVFRIQHASRVTWRWYYLRPAEGARELALDRVPGGSGRKRPRPALRPVRRPTEPGLHRPRGRRAVDVLTERTLQ